MNKKRLITGVLVALAIVLAGVVVMFAFGAPQSPVGSDLEVVATVATPPVAPAGASPVDAGAAEEPDAATGREASAAPVATGTVPEPDPASPFAIEIPGCVCHSDDPELVQQHSEYRMNQCFGCHAGGMPEMGR